MTVYTTLPTDDENLEVTVIDDPDLVTLNINPAQVTGSGGTTGTVERVDTGTGLTGGPITTTGTISIDETSDISFNSVTADMFGVQHFVAKARETISAGQPVYISGHSGNTPEVMVADYADPNKMPAFGIASTDIANNNNGSISTYGDLKNVDTTGTSEGETWAVGDSLYVNGAKLTNIRPTSATQEIQKVAKVIRVHANTGQMFLVGAGRSNDTPNLAHQNVFIGNAGGVERRQLTSADVTNSAGYITASTTDTLTNKSGSNSQWTNDEAYIKADSTDTLTNKSGSNSQWTNDEAYLKANALTPYYTSSQVDALPVSTFSNDAGYLTSETDNQTLSFTTPNLSITSGNTVDLTTLTTGFITASSTETLTNKSGSNSQWTNDEAYLQASALTPYYTSTQVDALPVSTFSNDAGYSTTTGTVTPSSTDTFTNKSGSNSQWTNDEAYIKADSTDTLTNKSGNISQWTNDSNYSTTTNNADNSVITGTGTTNTLNGESLFTYDGDHLHVTGTPDGYASDSLGNAVATLTSTNSGWDKAQLTLADSNAKVMGLVAEDDTNNDAMKYVIIMDPDGEHNPSGGSTGDYGFYYIKNYNNVGSNQITMEQNVFGARNGFIMNVKGDFDTFATRYDYKPITVKAESFTVKARTAWNTVDTALTVDNTKADFSVPVQLPNLTTTERNALTGALGMTIYNTDEDRIEYYDGAWKYISGTAV